MENQNDSFSIKQEPKWGDVIKNLSFIAIAIGLAYYVTVKVGIDDVRAVVDSAGVLAPLIIILLKATTLIVVPLGGTPLYPIAGALYGFWQGLGITIIGDILGSTVCFYLSRFFGKSIVNFFVPKEHIDSLNKIVERVSDTKKFFKARVFFLGLPELFAYAAGLTKVHFLTFITIHIGVHLILASLYVAFGDLLVSGNILLLIVVGIITSGLTLAGVLWFKKDITQSS